MSADEVAGMLKSCRYCGRVHTVGYECPKKPKRLYSDEAPRDSAEDKFRNRKSWRRKAEEIKERDLQLCRVCLAQKRYVFRDLSVHHIVPLREDITLGLVNDNLITLCRRCHEDAENGRFEREFLNELAVSPPISGGLE